MVNDRGKCAELLRKCRIGISAVVVVEASRLEFRLSRRPFRAGVSALAHERQPGGGSAAVGAAHKLSVACWLQPLTAATRAKPQRGLPL